MTAAVQLQFPQFSQTEPYSPVPTRLINTPGISNGAKLLYGRLKQYAGHDGRCFPKISTLARELAVSQRQINRYISELVRHGLVRVRRRGLGKSNVYYLCNPANAHRSDINVASGSDGNVASHPLYEENTQKKQQRDRRYFWTRARVIPLSEFLNHSIRRIADSGASETTKRSKSDASESNQLPVVNESCKPETDTGKSHLSDSEQAVLAMLMAMLKEPVDSDIEALILMALKKHGQAWIESQIEYTNERAKDNYPGYLRSSIQNDWAKKYRQGKEQAERLEKQRLEQITENSRKAAEEKEAARVQFESREALKGRLRKMPGEQIGHLLSQCLSEVNDFTRKRLEGLTGDRLIENIGFLIFCEGKGV